MNIENIEAFVHVIHYGGFKKAAEALFLSQPSVTARIKSLEQELNCLLFERTGKQIEISEDGKRFLPYAEQLLLIYQKGKQQLQQQTSLFHHYRIGCTISAAHYMIPKLLPYLNTRLPTASFKLVTGTTDDIVHKVRNKELDFALVRKTNHPGLQSVKLYVDPIMLYVYEDHPFLKQERVTIDEVARQKLVFFECGALDWLLIQRTFESFGERPHIHIHTDNNEMAKKLIIGRVGIGFLPGLSATREVRERKLFPVQLSEISGISLQTNLIALPGYHSELFELITKYGKPWVDQTFE
jgi:DNA-binding transcriptional LysR family regulator